MSKLVVIIPALSLVFSVMSAAFAQGRPALVNIDSVIVEPLAQTTPILGHFVALQSGDRFVVWTVLIYGSTKGG